MSKKVEGEFFNGNFSAYVTGSRFSDDASFRFPARPITGRDDYLIQACRNKRVLHVGCVDHLEIVDERIKNNTWLHGKLQRVATRCVGIDVNAEGIKYLAAIGIENVIYGDLIGPDVFDKLKDEVFDVVIFGEVLEHIDNPVKFLADFRTLYRDKVKTVIITVPNAFRHTNIKGIFTSREIINTDHRYWFTPYTIAKVVHCAGLTLSDIVMVTFSSHGMWKKLLFRLFPLMADDIVCLCTIE